MRAARLLCAAFVSTTSCSRDDSSEAAVVRPGGATEALLPLISDVLEPVARREQHELEQWLLSRGPTMPVDATSAEALARWTTESRTRLAEILEVDERGPETSAARWIVEPAASGDLREGLLRIELGDGVETVAVVTLPAEPGPHPLVLLLHGHEDRPFDDLRSRTTHQLAQYDIARTGRVVVRPLIRTFSQIDAAYWRHRKLVDMMLLRDELPLAQFVVDARRALTAIERLTAAGGLDADVTDVTLVGHSLGGAIALFTTIVDARVDRAVVANYVGDYSSALAAVEHCACGTPSRVTRRWNPADLAALVAPRPLLLVVGSDDP